MLTVKNKTDIPYGIFSNVFNDEFVLNTNKWNNIADYALSEYGVSNFKEPLSETMDKFWIDLEKTVINRSLRDGIVAKALADPNFEGLLLSADTRSILYVSDENFFGADLSTHKGENIYGKWLTSYKNQISEDSPTVFYNFYILNKFLKKAIEYEPLDSYLELARNGYGVQGLTKVLKEKYESSVEIPSIDLLERIRVEGNVKNFLYKPEEIILNVIQGNIRDVRRRNLKSYKIQIFLEFLSKTINDLGVNYDKNLFFNQLEPKERDYFIEKIFEAYLFGDFGEEKIEPKLYIPTQEDVEKYETLDLQGFKNPLPYSNHYALVDQKTSRLSMDDDKYLLELEGKHFPSIHHYVIYKIGQLINDPNFNPYSLILHSDGLFLNLEQSQNMLSHLLVKYKNNYFSSKIVEGIFARLNQKPYIADYIKSSRPRIIVEKDLIKDVSSKVYTELYMTIPWVNVMNTRGSVIEFIDSDSFFINLQKEFLESFCNVLSISTPGDFSFETIRNTYESFWGKISGTIQNLPLLNYDSRNLFELAKCKNIKLDNQSCNFLKNKFIQRILAAEELARKLFKSNIIFLTKFLILESQYRMFLGNFIDEKRYYDNKFTYETVALSNVINSIANCNNFKVVKPEHIMRAYKILTTYKLDFDNRVETNEINKIKTIHESHENPIELKSLESYNDIQYENNNDVNFEVLDKDIDDEEEQDFPYEDDSGDEQEEDYNDFMFANNAINLSAKSIVTNIMKSLQTTKDNWNFFIEASKKLRDDHNKNKYRIFLWQ